jgi:AmpD protein
MKIDKQTGLLQNVTYIASPNCDYFPDNVNIDLLVIHSISLPPDEFDGDGVQALFTNSLDPTEHSYYQQILNLRVSAHFFVRRDGSILQFVPVNRRAWHAGASEFQGRSACNDFSLGIELEGCDTQPFTEQQYQQLAKLTRAIIEFYPSITAKHIVGHSDIAPGRKSDPGPHFDWNKYFALITIKN